MTKERYLRASRKERLKYLAMRHPLTILGGYISIFIVGMCIVPALSDLKGHKDSALALILHVVLYTFVVATFGWLTALFAIFIPFFVAGAMGSYLFYAQHNFPSVVFKEKDGWTYEGAALESSSFCTMSPIMHYFTGNIGYHHIHHLNSKIPFYRLPEVYAKMPEVQNAKTTSLRPLEVLKCLSLKIWDADQQPPFTPSAPVQRRLQCPRAKSKFLAATRKISPFGKGPFLPGRIDFRGPHQPPRQHSDPTERPVPFHWPIPFRHAALRHGSLS